MKTVELNKITLTLLEPRIIKMEITGEDPVDINDMYEARTVNLELSGGEKYCILLDTSQHFLSTTLEVRELTANAQFSKHRLAAAFLVESTATRLAGTMFIHFHKPATPTRAFSNEKDALDWLRSYLQ